MAGLDFWLGAGMISWARSEVQNKFETSILMSTGSIHSEETASVGGMSMKLKNVIIHDFRSFSLFRIEGMGRVTLLVGTNNSGKTTVLEALLILLANGDPSSIWSILSRRGEDFLGERDPNVSLPSTRQVDIRRLIRGHEIEVGRGFSLKAETDIRPVSMFAKVEELKPAQPTLFDTEPPPSDSTEEFLPPLALTLSWTPGRPLTLPISRRGGISLDSIRRWARPAAVEGLQVRFVTASSLSAELVTMQFEDIVLTPAEDLVLQAMRIIEPDIERIALAGADRIRAGSRYSTGRGGLYVKLKGVRNRVPIGSMGDGLWRMLGLALAVVQPAGGLLLVDEIDTGLHHTVMRDLWRFLYSCAKEFDVQIVATTHSRDCFQSLAVICRDDVAQGSDVTIHRIEKGQSETVAYTEQEIVAAADFDMEVR
jgi:ABC-type Na+ transport system ATPase subunit NatA